MRDAATHPRKHPEWIRVRAPGGETFRDTAHTLTRHGVHTICEEALCPNIGECWAHRSATFLLMGDVCTRRCRFCDVTQDTPAPVDPSEPERVAAAVRELGLRHIVLTSVNRDDLPDGGARHIARTVTAIHETLPFTTIEVLVPDFRGEAESVAHIVASPIAVFSHNVETVPRLYSLVRPGARYERSLDVLALAQDSGRVRTKAGLMLGLGETAPEIDAVLRDLRLVGVDIVTLGQYLRPTHEQLPVVRYVPPEEFIAWKRYGEALGFAHVESGPLVRSSYHAWEHAGVQAPT